MHTRALEFVGASGQPLSARLDEPEGPVLAHVLFAHCFTCSKSSLATVRIARALAAHGFAVARFDFTGLGDSGGDFADASFSGDVRDLVAIAAQMAGLDMAPRLLVGHSLGGAAAIAAAHDIPSAAAVAVIGAPFDPSHVTRLLGGGLQRLQKDGEAEVDLGGRPFRLKRSFIDDLGVQDQKSRIAGLGRPLMILHSPLDEVVGIDNASQIFLAAHHPKSFVSLDKADHLLTREADAAFAAEVIAAWASRYVHGAVSAVTEEPPGAVRVDSWGLDGFQVEVRVGGLTFLADEPVEVGGAGAGPTPYDLVSTGLAACTAMTLRMYARQKGWPLEHVQVRVTHSKSQERTPPDLFRREILIEGALDPAQRQRLLEIAERCPVHKTLEGGSAIETAAVELASPAAAR
jgi:putative redox protein